MRDIKLITPGSSDAGWNLDFDFIDGVPVFVNTERNTQDQRAAVSAYMVQGTVPGKPDVGINYSDLYTQNTTIVSLDNNIKQNIQKNAAIPGSAVQAYIPIYDITEEGIKIGIVQTA